MGSISVDTRKSERPYELFNLSDHDVVRYLILFRDKIDTAFQIEQNNFYHDAGDTFKFNVEILSLYIELDKLLAKCKLTDRQKLLLEYFTRGYTVADIGNEFGFSRSSVTKSLDIIVGKVVSKNNQNWIKFMDKYSKIN